MNKKKEKILVLREVAEDLIKTKFLTRSEIEKIHSRFFKVMRKHGIKKGEKINGGIKMSNYEWTFCKGLFIERILIELQVAEILDNNLPEDLEHY